MLRHMLIIINKIDEDENWEYEEWSCGTDKTLPIMRAKPHHVCYLIARDLNDEALD